MMPLPPQGVTVMRTWCDTVVHLGETLSRWISTFPDFPSQESSGQECGELLCLSVRVSEFGGQTEDGLYPDSEVLATVKEPAMLDLTNTHVKQMVFI